MPSTGMKITAMIQAIAEDGCRLADRKLAAATMTRKCAANRIRPSQSSSIIVLPV